MRNLRKGDAEAQLLDCFWMIKCQPVKKCLVRFNIYNSFFRFVWKVGLMLTGEPWRFRDRKTITCCRHNLSSI